MVLGETLRAGQGGKRKGSGKGGMQVSPQNRGRKLNLDGRGPDGKEQTDRNVGQRRQAKDAGVIPGSAGIPRKIRNFLVQVSRREERWARKQVCQWRKGLL